MGSVFRSFRCVALLSFVIVFSGSPEAQTGTPPVQVMLASPTGGVSTRRPALVWDAQPGVVYYLVRVMERTTTTDNWVTAAAAGCGAGTGTCAVMLAHDLDLGQIRWQALAWNTFGYGPWSSTQEFIINAVDPMAAPAIAQSPGGPLADEWVPFQWVRVPDAVWYRLWRRDGAGVEFERWFRPSEAGCVDSEACQVTITPYLANGNGSWKVQAWTATGSGPWSVEKTFVVTLPRPATPQPAAPNSTTTEREPVFTWPATPHTWYYLLRVWVGSTFTDRWYTPDAAGCAPGTSTPCVVRPDATLPFGSVSWQLIAWNRSGYSEWSGLVTFLVVDQDPPTITATFAPMPDSGGWNNTNVTVTFTCADQSGIAVCTSPVQVSGEGEDIPVTGTATDIAGNTYSKTWSVKIDRSAPVVHVFYPREGSRVPASTPSGQTS